MATKTLQVVTPKPVPAGTQEYEAKRASILQAISDKIPQSLWLPENIISNPPLDVTTVFRTCGLLSEKELAITENYDATALAAAIASRQLTAVEVTVAFCKRAAIAHQLTCCLTNFFMEEAVAQAQQLDDYLQHNGKVMGPLHGVPVSLKEHMPIIGQNTSWGHLATVMVTDYDCHMVQILRAAGAVFYVKTNQPQAIMHLESTSFYGRTLMPHNINLSAGGSSGGEAALVACRGSVLGVGTDIGGSIRGPSAFCGIYGFKPTAYTLPMKDFLPGGFPAELTILACSGPMCTTLRDCELFVQAIKATNPYLIDPRIVPIPWTGLATPVDQPLKIGIMPTDGVIIPQPPVLAALAWAQQLLEASPHVVLKPFIPYKPAVAIANIRKAYYPDSAIAKKKLLAESGEPMLSLTQWIIKDAEDSVERTGTEVNAMRWDRDVYRSDFSQHWNAQDVDFVLGPCFVGPASAHDTAFYCE